MYNICTGIYKFGNNTYPWRIIKQVEFRSYFSGKNSASYGLGNMVRAKTQLLK